MDSLSKNRLDAKHINALAQHAFGRPADAFTENSIGEFSALYMVKLADKEVVLKVAPKDTVRVLRYEKNSMQTEVEALKIVRENTSIPVPEVLFYDASKSHCDSEYLFMEKMDGTNLYSLSAELNTEQDSRIMFQLGEYNRQINEIRNDKFGNLTQAKKQHNGWQTAFTSMFSDILNDGKDAGIEFPLPYDEVWSTVSSFLYACDDVKIPKLVHWDLWKGNVLVHDEKITGIIDFERALYADPLMEYLFRTHAVNADFCVGYGIDFSSLNKNARIRVALYDLYLALIYVIEFYYRQYDKSQYGWREGRLLATYKALEKF